MKSYGAKKLAAVREQCLASQSQRRRAGGEALAARNVARPGRSGLPRSGAAACVGGGVFYGVNKWRAASYLKVHEISEKPAPSSRAGADIEQL